MPDIRALIADDEPLARRGVRQLLERQAGFTVVGEVRNGRETLSALETLAPDLLFLDIQMPDLDGFGVVRARGPDRMPSVVFVTAYDEYAVRAFEVHALDYLVKPIVEARFEATIQRVREQVRREAALDLARRLTALVAEPAPSAPPLEPRLLVPTASGELVLDTSEIDWIEARDYYARVHAGGRRHLIRESLASLEARLDPGRFVRVHRSAILRLDRVRELSSTPTGETVAILKDGSLIPVSRRRREHLALLLRATAR
ncbi:MAG: response regulator transcription factor [Gemmatimonadales bacterium]|nr:response regulator transcription factor [Gemmatimonadales bacterium]